MAVDQYLLIYEEILRRQKEQERREHNRATQERVAQYMQRSEAQRRESAAATDASQGTIIDAEFTVVDEATKSPTVTPQRLVKAPYRGM